MNIDQLFAELGDGTLPDGLVEELMRIGSALQASTVDNLYVVQGNGFELRLQGAVIDDEAMIGIRIDSPNVQRLIHGSCNVFSLFRLTWVLGGLKVETLEDVLEDEEILEAIHLIVTKGEEADEDAYDLLDFEITQLVSEAFMQGIPAAVIRFALAHTDNLCPHHFTHEVTIGTIMWEDRFRNYGVLSVEEAEGLADIREEILADYIGSAVQPGILLLWLQWFDSVLQGTTASFEKLLQNEEYQKALVTTIMAIEERMPDLSHLIKVAVVGGLIWDATPGESDRPSLNGLALGIQATTNWLVASGHLHEHIMPQIFVDALSASHTLGKHPKVRTLQYGPW